MDALQRKLSSGLNKPLRQLVNQAKYKEACRYYNKLPDGCKRGPSCYFGHYEETINGFETAKEIYESIAESKESMGIIVGLILQFAIKSPESCVTYTKLCKWLYSYEVLSLMVNTNTYPEWLDKNAAKTIRGIIIGSANDMFNEYKNHSTPDTNYDLQSNSIKFAADVNSSKKSDLLTAGFVKNSANVSTDIIRMIYIFYYDFRRYDFLNMMVMIAELYNAGIIQRNVLYKGVFDVLLPPKNYNVSEIDLQGLCKVFERSGKKLEEEGHMHFEKYLQKLQSHSLNFTNKTRLMVDRVIRKRKNFWWK